MWIGISALPAAASLRLGLCVGVLGIPSRLLRGCRSCSTWARRPPCDEMSFGISVAALRGLSAVALLILLGIIGLMELRVFAAFVACVAIGMLLTPSASSFVDACL